MVSLRLMPRDVKFFELFITDGDNLLAAARELNDLVSSYDQLDERIARIQALEHAGDEIGDVIAERLDQAFITPFDREDIHELVVRLDDVVDGIQETAETLQIYDIEAPTDEAKRLSAILAEQSSEIVSAIGKLESMKGLDQHLKRIRELEHEADGLSRAAIGQLFRQDQEPLNVIKWRDVYQLLEESIDAAEDVAEIIQRMLHKAA
jgi:predicted phosphate transport protein (TIGR00153 family)